MKNGYIEQRSNQALEPKQYFSRRKDENVDLHEATVQWHVHVMDVMMKHCRRFLESLVAGKSEVTEKLQAEHYICSHIMDQVQQKVSCWNLVQRLKAEVIHKEKCLEHAVQFKEAARGKNSPHQAEAENEVKEWTADLNEAYRFLQLNIDMDAKIDEDMKKVKGQKEYVEQILEMFWAEYGANEDALMERFPCWVALLLDMELGWLGHQRNPLGAIMFQVISVGAAALA